MTVLDAFALVGFLRGEPCAGQVEELFGGITAISSANLAEVIDLLVRVFGFGEDELLGDLALLQQAGLDVVDVDTAIATRAALLRARHYGSKRCPVSLADCVALATAERLRQPLATADPDLLRVARDESVAVCPLPDSSGRMPPARSRGRRRPALAGAWA
ncbi:MAG: PIN domain-containing protein [Actinobacteria bacterium]|nr:PIN domain-containing protein [Actinomycetota bacterium]